MTVSCATSATSRVALPASEYQRRLREARVVILGVGGRGTLGVSGALCAAGSACLCCFDGDLVEESNFNRQILYREGDVGRPKAEGRRGGARRVRARAAGSPLWLARSRERGRRARVCRGRRLRGETGADWPAHDIERWVNAACFDAGCPFITMSHSPPVARVGPLYVPGTTGCFACQERTYREEFPLYDQLVDQRRGRAPKAATLGPVCAFIGGQVALETLHHLTGLFPPASLGHVPTCTTSGRWSVSREPVPARRGLRGLRNSTRPVPRGGFATCIGPVHACGPNHGTWSRVRPSPPRHPIHPIVPSAHERMFVREQISAPATRPRPGAWHRRQSFGASTRYASAQPANPGCLRVPRRQGDGDGARVGGGSRAARGSGSRDGACSSMRPPPSRSTSR